MGGRDQKKVEDDYKIFLRDLEDPELRSGINLYKASDVKMDGPEEKVGVKKGRGKKVQYAMEVDESDVVPERGQLAPWPTMKKWTRRPISPMSGLTNCWKGSTN